MTTKATVRKNQITFSDQLWIRRGGVLSIISIDRTYDALYWMNRHEMTRRYSITAENGEIFDIYQNDQYDRICAVPAA